MYRGGNDSIGEKEMGDDPITEAYKFYLPTSNRIMVSVFFFAMATLTRSSGLFLAIYVIFFMLNKIIRRASQCCTVLKLVFYCYIGAIIMLLPLCIIMFWKPYMIHCDTKLDRTDQIPDWCLDKLPNVYSHI
jgi:Gpi18-like mannosyltransferase